MSLSKFTLKLIECGLDLIGFAARHVATTSMHATAAVSIFPPKIKVPTGKFKYPPPDVTLGYVSAVKVFERHPTHPLEQRWAVYVNLSRLERMVLFEKSLPKFALFMSEMHWVSKRGSIQWENAHTDLPELYLFRFSYEFSVGQVDFAPCGVVSEEGPCDPDSGTFDFYHEAPEPILPWPGVCIRGFEMPRELSDAVNEGIQQAQEAIWIALGKRNPAITALMA